MAGSDTEVLQQLRRLNRALASRYSVNEPALNPTGNPADALAVISARDLDTVLQGSNVQMPVDIQSVWHENVVATGTPLGAGLAFTSGVIDNLQMSALTGYCYSDQGGTLQVQQCQDNVNFTDDVRTFTVIGGTPKSFTVGIEARFAKVYYLNGGVGQTAFRLFANRWVM